MSARTVAAAALALSLSFGLPALAQTGTNGAPPPAANTPGGPQAAPNGGWGDEVFQRQDLREEMEQIRKEHEEIEAATDRLIDKCVKAGGAQTETCEKDKQALKERRERLHQRREALRQKVEEAHKERREDGHGPMGGDMGGMNMGAPGQPQPMGGNGAAMLNAPQPPSGQ